MEQNFIDITPTVALLTNLRDSGIDNLAAIGEFVDNSIDAGAMNIKVKVFEIRQNDKLYRNIMIADNGKGIPSNNIKPALTIGQRTKTSTDQLGKYGMGMKTAALSLTENFEVLTKSASGQLLYTEFNAIKMKQTNKFETFVRPADGEELSFFENELGNSRSGTVILLKYCDRINLKEISHYGEKLKAYLGRVYRKSIMRGVRIELQINNQKSEIKAIDPLMRNHPSTTIIADSEIYSIEVMEGNRKIHSVAEVSAVLLPSEKELANGDEEITINQSNQGMYILRERREIANGVAYTNVWGEKHNSKNRYRIEIALKPDVDEAFRMDFNKGRGNPTAELKHQLYMIVNPIITRIREAERKEQPATLPPKVPTHPIPPKSPQPISPKPVVTSPTITSTPAPTSIGPVTDSTNIHSGLVLKRLADPHYKLVNQIAEIVMRNEFKLELNTIEWEANKAVYDLRFWDQDNNPMINGVAMSKNDLIKLRNEIDKLI